MLKILDKNTIMANVQGVSIDWIDFVCKGLKLQKFALSFFEQFYIYNINVILI